MERQAKLRRLERFRRCVPHVSCTALAKILKLAADGIPEITDRNAIREARDLQSNELTEYGTLVTNLQLERIDGSPIDLCIVNPFAHLVIACRECPGFANLIRDKLVVHPCTPEAPWRLIIYADEVVPGNQLANHNARKVWAIYYALMEYGAAVLSDEDAWTCIAAERTDNVKQMSGGIAQVFDEILCFLFAAGGHTMQHSGVLLELNGGGRVRLWIELFMITQDGAAHKMVFCVKGDAGHKFCTECRNLYAVQSNIIDEDNEPMLTCSLVLREEMDFADDEDIRGTVKRLAWYALNRPDELALRSQACGFNHVSKNMLLDPRLDDVLKPITHKAHDWMHAMLIRGVFNVTACLFVKALIHSGVTDAAAQFEAYILAWTLPTRVKLNIARLASIFSANRWKASNKAHALKCMASEALSIYGIMACYTQSVFLRAGVCTCQCQAFLHCCNVLDLLLAVPLGYVTEEDLRDAIDDLLKACVAAGWKDRLTPKFHWLIHLSIELGRFGGLLACFVQERKHKVVKRFAELHRNNMGYETGILADIVCQHLADLYPADKFNLKPRLMEPVHQCSDAVASTLRLYLDDVFTEGDMRTSRRARVSEFEVVSIKDVALVQWEPGRIVVGVLWYLFACGETTAALFSLWPVESRDESQGTVIARMLDTRLRICSVEEIICAVSYRRKPDGTAQIIVPCSYRDFVDV
jgi:hypothetical protein